jgi:hypothetical protein
MKFYKFKVVSSTGKRITIQVFSNEEVKAKKVFDVIDKLNQEKKVGIIDDYDYQEIYPFGNTMKTIIEHMSFGEFKKMLLLISQEEKEQVIKDKMDYETWC